MINDFANQNEIKHAHDILLGRQSDFDQDKINIIECNESRDIQACPGSGKTTTLLAKLIILADRMPLPNNQGICVLTHTNVAINEIKSKLGIKANVLFSYPNFFGTIQTFVDKFMAIPYYANKYKKHPSIISDDAYFKAMDRSFFASKKNHKKIFDKLYMYYKYGRIDKHNVRLVFKDSKLELVDTISNNSILFKKPHSKKNWTEDEKNEMTDLMIRIINNIHFFYSVLSYSDSYQFAKEYISANGDLISKFSSRFKYLFIDEMQDVNKTQKDIIDKIFNKNRIVVQRFGDPYQAIYNNVSAENIWIPEEPLHITNSKRFGENIAKVLRTVCMSDNKTLSSYNSIDSLKPILIVYDHPSNVLPKFVQLLKEKKIGGKTIYELAEEMKNQDKLHCNYIKAVGWVGTENSDDKITIKSYFPSFDKNKVKKEKVNYDSLKSFIRKSDSTIIKDYADKIIDAILHVLSTAGCRYKYNGQERNYTKVSFIDKFKQISEDKYKDFRVNLAKWVRQIDESTGIYSISVVNEIKEYLSMNLNIIFGYKINGYVKKFIESNNSISDVDEGDDINTSSNIYENQGVQVEVGTVHSVKGETHAATLYLETSYYSKCESQRIADQLKGLPYNGTPQKMTIESLKIAYVGMSRPKYLLCMAIQKKHFNFYCEELRKNWEIIEI
jgi:DNA helicase II / ATP-dependent DNA helicase PcrA